MEKSGVIVLRGKKDPLELPEAPHEPIYRMLCARYQEEHQKSPTAWMRYLLYEDARLQAVLSVCGQKRQHRLPQKLVYNSVRAIDEVCQKSHARKPWRKKSALSKSDRLTNAMLKLAIKKKMTKTLALGVVRATATVGCTNDYCRRVWFGTVFFAFAQASILVLMCIG